MTVVRCPKCSTALKYRRRYLSRDGWWCTSCYGWCRPVVVRSDAASEQMS